MTLTVRGCCPLTVPRSALPGPRPSDTPSYRMEFIASLRVKVHSRGNGVHVLEYSNVLEQVVKRAFAGRNMPMDHLDPDTSRALKSPERGNSNATGLSQQRGGDEGESGDGSNTSINTRNSRRLSKAESVAYSQLAAAVVIQRAHRRKNLRQGLRRKAAQVSRGLHA